MNICVLIPIFNEAIAIGQIVESIKKEGFDVIIFNDGSTDASGTIAKDKGAIVINNNTRCGKGYSLREGFSVVLDKGYDGVITMDGDGQHAISDLSVFMNKIQKYPKSVIVGNRMKNPKGMPVVRYLTNRFMSWLISIACKQTIEDSQCGYRYISSEVLKSLDLQCDGFEIETEILIKTFKNNFKIFSVPVKTIYEDEESKIVPLKDTLRFFSYYFKELWKK